MSRPWFRMYSRFPADPVVEEMAFEDQRHFIVLLCLKCDGLLDKAFQDAEMRERVISRRLGLQGEAYTNARQRLVASGLVDENLQPTSWDALQFSSDVDPTAAERKRRQRERHGEVTRDGVVTVTRTDQIRSDQNRSDRPASKLLNGGGRETSPPKPPRRASALVPLPEGFALTAELASYASTKIPDANVTELFTAFCDQARSKAWKYADWPRAWQTYVRNCAPNSGHWAAGQYPRAGAGGTRWM